MRTTRKKQGPLLYVVFAPRLPLLQQPTTTPLLAFSSVCSLSSCSLSSFPGFKWPLATTSPKETLAVAAPTPFLCLIFFVSLASGLIWISCPAVASPAQPTPSIFPNLSPSFQLEAPFIAEIQCQERPSSKWSVCTNCQASTSKFTAGNQIRTHMHHSHPDFCNTHCRKRQGRESFSPRPALHLLPCSVSRPK
jgi:hypothetical protein